MVKVICGPENQATSSAKGTNNPYFDRVTLKEISKCEVIFSLAIFLQLC